MESSTKEVWHIKLVNLGSIIVFLLTIVFAVFPIVSADALFIF